jgi:uncharacterized protein YbbC (DUF1343 family)
MNYIYLSILTLCVVTSVQADSSFALGVENIPHNFFSKLQKRMKLDRPIRVGLITNQTGITQTGVRTLDVLRQHGADVRRLFVPEHGYDGTIGAGETVHDSRDAESNLEVVSLYEPGKSFFGKIKNNKKVSQHAIHDLDVLVFDIQDSGMRHYTYISTLFDVMKGVAHEKKYLVVLDRPNPLGVSEEGSLVEPKFTSFVSIAPIPVRHGMTVGELARYFNRHLFQDNPAHLSVVPMRHYNRSQGFNGAFLANLSPGICKEAAVYGYSFLGLLGEVRPFNFKRGLDMSSKYQCLSLKNEAIEGKEDVLPALSELLTKYEIPHTAYKDEKYAGFELDFKHANFNSFSLMVNILKTCRKHNVEITFAKEFDLSAGTDKVRDYVMGKMQHTEFVEYINSNLQDFYARAEPIFLYHPHPVPKYLK